MKRKRKVIIFLITITLFILTILLFPTWTPKIEGVNSVAELKQIEINGTKLEVMIRGVDKSNPIIIFVHGGPGCSEIPYVRKYQDLLEEHFTIVHYDQRGSGKSFHFFEDYSNISIDQHVEDLLALTEYVKNELHQEKVILIGHSFGTNIGLQAASQNPNSYAAYVGIGQVSNIIDSETDSLEYTIDQAHQAGNQKDLEQLELLRDSIKSGEALTPRSMVRKYGGAARLIDDNMDYFTGFLTSPEYNVLDVIRYFSGISATQAILLNEQNKKDITTIVDKVDIPLYFVMGKYDYMTSTKAAKEYFDQLEAPVKDFVVFESSAHYPQFEEEVLFAEWLIKTWRSLEK
ncbi:alpha/beta fold hydrolase [Ureibacillus manganicus]|uniref:Alpha/beta hydrolase n=1 Tax=Ureibacillus manganicus DSM 26584 TaxID=1384049 RepID=A0A0A3HZG3_9BACL|nr:alpha/beta hydrolase [Ureibacillus manganicus]KGR77981.1 alpha/beta hydrolase [Ureibacillus manganicus DSM 26584]